MNTKYDDIYKTHRDARREHTVWLDEIERLRARNSQSLALLELIITHIRRYDAGLQAYASDISAYEIEVQLDEELIAQQQTLGVMTQEEHLTTFVEGVEQVVTFTKEYTPQQEYLAILRRQFEEELDELHEDARRYEKLSAEYTEKVRPLLAAVRELV
ncbi:MAG: hypothetical protein KDJ65_24040 [Anaerolineae bacterium]|nr:hypothetical protein [Anaerolineae bacterium]